MTLTAEELLYYRDLIGDIDLGAYDLNDTVIQAAFDRAAAFGLDDDITEARTMVYLLRRLRGRARKLHDARGEVESESFNQVWEHLNQMLEYYEEQAGMTGGVSGIIQVGTMNLGIDYTTDDLEAGL